MIRRRPRIAYALPLLAWPLLWPATASPQSSPPRFSDGLTLPSQNLASTDDSTAVGINPANLAFRPGAEARIAWTHTGEDARLPIRGVSLNAAGSLWILGTGLQADWFMPPGAAPAPFAIRGTAFDYGWVRWGSAIRFGELAAIGTTLAWSHATHRALSGHFTVTSGLTVRPHAMLSMAAVARDWVSAENDIRRTLDTSLDLGAALRPLGGHRMLEIGGTASYDGERGRWTPGITMAADIPWLGRFHAGARMVDTDAMHVVANAAVDMNIDQLMLRAGGIFGPALSNKGSAFHVAAAFRSYRESVGVTLPARVVRFRIRKTPGVRQHTRLLRRLWALSEADDVDAVLFEIRANPAPSLPHAEELVDAIGLLRRRGKKVLCHLEDATGRTLFVCAAANRITMNPAGGLRFAGLSSRRLYLGGLLDKLGVEADFVRIGAHKLAPEQFADGPSDVAIRDREHILRRIEILYIDGIARGRKLSRKALRKALAGGPYLAHEARAVGLIDELVYQDEIERYLEGVVGRKLRVVDDKVVPEIADHWRGAPRIAVVYLHGTMIDGESRTIPGLGIRLAGSRTIAKSLAYARKDKSVRAVILRVETGGGSSLAADVILREAQLCAKAKPLIVSMGASAASGGYYASVAGKHIFANRGTMTGSIGIFYGKVDVSGLLSKLGVRSHSLRTAPRADAESLFRPFTEAERRVLGVKVKQIYELFVARVASGRSMSVEAVDAVARGRVWTGLGASTRGLVDEIGGLRQALALARRLGGLPRSSRIVEWPAEEPSLIARALKLGGLDVGRLQLASDPLWLPPQLRQAVASLAPLLLFGDRTPMALSDLVVPLP
jgi:protease-4